MGGTCGSSLVSSSGESGANLIFGAKRKLTTTALVSPDCMSLLELNPVEPPWYVTRMPGGVGGWTRRLDSTLGRARFEPLVPP